MHEPSAFQGGYTKHAAMPGGSLLQLPTVVVDVTDEAITLFACVDVPLVGHVPELVVATRARVPSSDVVEQQIALASSLGVPFDRADVKAVDHSSCARREEAVAAHPLPPPKCEAELCHNCIPGNTSHPAGTCCNSTWHCSWDGLWQTHVCLPPTPWICSAPPPAVA